MPASNLYPVLFGNQRKGPTTPLLELFNRADENPLAGPWTGGAFGVGSAAARIISNAGTGNGITTTGSSYYNVGQMGPNCEAYFTMTTKWAGDGAGWFLLTNWTSPGTASVSGYLFTSYGSSGDIAEIYKCTNNSLSIIGATVTGLTISVGDSFLARSKGGTLVLWQYHGGVWAPIVTRTDTTYLNGGYIGFGCDNDVIAIDNFGGGSIS